METKKSMMIKIDNYEKAYLEMKKWDKKTKLSSSTRKILRGINYDKDREIAPVLKFLSNLIQDAVEEKENYDDGKLYLSDIMKIESPKMTKNNLILSPVGSGKSFFSESLIDDGDNILFLVSTTSLKESLVPNNESLRKEMSDRSYSTKKRKIYGSGNYKKLVMTYSEFGKRIEYEDDFARQFSKIICDEIHSLQLYHTYKGSGEFLVAIRYLFSRHEDQPKYYFTATNAAIEDLRKVSGKLLNNLNVIDFLDHPDIKRHIPLSKDEITGIEQVRPRLRSRVEAFKHFNHKIFAFCKTIDSQLRLKKICEEEGFTAQAYWSINNKERKLTEKQVTEIGNMITTGMLPDDYDVIIINSSLQEGWNLLDRRVKLAILNTLDNTEYIQALGRIRRDVDVVIYRVKSDGELIVRLPNRYIGVDLNSEDKNVLCEEIGLRNENGRLYKWTTIKKFLKKQGYIIEDKVKYDNNTKRRVSFSTIKNPT